MENNFSAYLGIYQNGIDRQIKKIREHNFTERLWNKDESLWKNYHSHSMGWIDVADKMMEALPDIQKFCKEIHESGFSYFVLLGMGGSSMAPMVFQQIANSSKNNFFILDSTEPETIKNIENKINLSKTLFIVSSKSGSTAEVTALFNYFFYKVNCLKPGKPGKNFIAITDSGSPLSILAAKNKFRKIFINFNGIGGRFSALSYFGIVPAALMGINIKEILKRAQSMMKKCGADVPIEKNQGIFLGIILAELAEKCCDKLTYLIPSKLNSFGLWLEQLLAESTGKDGKGIMPFNGFPFTQFEICGNDRFFLSFKYFGQNDEIQDNYLYYFIQRKFNPVINITIIDDLDIAAEFFRWEVATVTAGFLLDLNPFDQPNVQESKTYTEILLRNSEIEGLLPKTEPSLKEDSLTFFAKGKEENSGLLIENFFSTSQPGDYIALLTYLPENFEVKNKLMEIEHVLQESLHIPVSTQFGPRYLHSTGQYHKGGPQKGYFIQFIYQSPEDIPIPGKHYSFGTLKNAQALGDMEALIKHKRKVIMIDLGSDIITGLNKIKQLMEKMRNEILVV